MGEKIIDRYKRIRKNDGQRKIMRDTEEEERTEKEEELMATSAFPITNNNNTYIRRKRWEEREKERDPIRSVEFELKRQIKSL